MAAEGVAVQAFRDRFGRAPALVGSAPGRVNLIGEHTDYNDGFVLPMAIDRRVSVAAAPRDDDRVVIHSAVFDGTDEFTLPVVRQAGSSAVWSAYVRAVLWAMESAGMPLRGMDATVAGNVPLAAGLSSSAALELAVARVCCEMAGVTWDPVAMARLGQRAENEFVGVQCGIMDQVAASCSRAGHAMLLDCRTLAMAWFPTAASAAVVVMNTGVRRSLAGSEYNERRSACDAVVSAIREREPSVRALRDVTRPMLDAARGRVGDVAWKRALHVVTENARPAAFAEALSRGDVAGAGALMDESHASLRDLYEVSSTHLELICDAARDHPACHGARLTGAGFGGCAIALVDADGAADFIASVQPAYEAKSYRKSEFFVARADDGARVDA